jgi:hypothetical protein
MVALTRLMPVPALAHPGRPPVKFDGVTSAWPPAPSHRAGLEVGKAAAGVLALVSEASLVADKLNEVGGAAEAHVVSGEALEEAHQAATTDTA